MTVYTSPNTPERRELLNAMLPAAVAMWHLTERRS